jgi:hypothetical protein
VLGFVSGFQVALLTGEAEGFLAGFFLMRSSIVGECYLAKYLRRN